VTKFHFLRDVSNTGDWTQFSWSFFDSGIEYVYRRKTDNTMAKVKSKKGNTTIVELLSKHIVSQNISFIILIQIAS
jgi:hypothetical protein